MFSEIITVDINLNEHIRKFSYHITTFMVDSLFRSNKNELF